MVKPARGSMERAPDRRRVLMELKPFLESGVSVHVATRDATLRPDSTRAVGSRVDGAAEMVTVFLPVATAAGALANLRDNGRLAVTFSRPIDHATWQLKGALCDLARAGTSDLDHIRRYRDALACELALVGVPPALTRRVAHWPCHAVRFRVEEVYVQTPGPNAGGRIA
jgi:hypothetical protein